MQSINVKRSKLGVAWFLLIMQAIQVIQYWKGVKEWQEGGTILDNVLEKHAWKAMI